MPDQDVRNEGVIDRTFDSQRKYSDFPVSSRDLGHTLCIYVPNPFLYLTHLTLLFSSIASDLATPEFQGPRLVLFGISFDP
jgi:hypothetical protein